MKCWPTPEKMRLAYTWKNPLLPHPEKNLSDAHATLCADQGFSNFFARPTTHQTHHFAKPHLCWCINTIVQIRQCFSVFNWPNHFGAAESKVFGCWSQNAFA